jgi:hypothetical protein
VRPEGGLHYRFTKVIDKIDLKKKEKEIDGFLYGELASLFPLKQTSKH